MCVCVCVCVIEHNVYSIGFIIYISLTDNMYMVLDVIKVFVLYILCGTMVFISVIGHSEGVCMCYRMYMLIIRYVRSAKRLNGEVLYIYRLS